MKRIFSLLILFTLIFTLGCNKEEEISSGNLITAKFVTIDNIFDSDEKDEEVVLDDGTKRKISKTVGLCQDADGGEVKWENETIFEFYDGGKRIIAQVLNDDAGLKIEDVKEKIEEVIEENKTVRLCYDSDRGIIRWVNGSIFGFYDNTTRFEFEDYCINRTYLREYYCENEIPLQMDFYCKNTCQDAHCL